MSTIVTRAGKGSPLTHNEVDANFTNLNNDKYQSGSALGTPASGTLTNCTGYTYANLSGTVPTWNQNTTGNAATVTNGVYTSDIGSTVLAYDSNLQSFVNTFTLPTTDSTSGYVLATNGSGILSFVEQSGGGSGTVTSVAMTVPTGLTVTGSPITSSGTFAVTLTSGYTIPSTTSTGQWDTAYTDRLKWDGGSTGLTASTGRTSLGVTATGSDTTYAYRANNLSDLASASTARTNLGLAIGTNVLAYDSNLQSFVNTFTLPTTDGSANQVLKTDGAGNIGFATISGAGTVTSVDMTVPTGLAVSGNPITSSGTLAVTYASGYAIPTTAKQTEWDSAYTQRLQWDGGATNLVASTGRASLLPSYTSNAGKVLAVNTGATDVEWIAVGGSGTVTSVSGTGTVNGITLTGTVTTSGSLTLGGTLSGIGNSQLANSSVTFNGQTVALGDSGTITANTTNALTIGTGLSGTSFNGSGAVTIANTGVLSNVAGTGISVSGATGNVTITNSSPMTYPDAGIPNSTGSAWGTSYTTSGSGTVVALATGATLTNPLITGTITEDVYTITDGAGFSIDPTNGSIQTITLGASRTPTVANFEAGEAITLMIDDGTAYTITWTTIGVVWVGGSAPTLATTGFTVIELWRVGSTYYGALVGNVA